MFLNFHLHLRTNQHIGTGIGNHGCEHSEGYICLLLSLSLYVCVNNDIMYYVYIIYSLSDGNEPKCDTVGIPYKPVTFRT